MKCKAFILIFTSLIVLNISGVYADEPLRIGVITDIHYLSYKLMNNESQALQKYIQASGRTVEDTPAVLDKVLSDCLTNGIDILLVLGDITKDGEKQSHVDFVEKFRPLREKGTRVFVLPGNHDINMPNAVGYGRNGTYVVENTTSKEFETIYADCGYGKALFRDTVSLSYVASINKDTWLLAIDAARYKEYKDRSISSGRISPATEEWIIDVLEKAKSSDKRVIAMMHWGLVEHIPYQSVMFKDYLVDDWERIADLLANNGVKAIFTGHFHSNDISSFTSEEGNTIYDIETGTLASYPYSYRVVDVYRNRMAVRTKNITGIENNLNLAEKSRLQMQRLGEKQAGSRLKTLGYDIPEDIIKQLSAVLGKIFVLHLYGDEKPDEELKEAMSKLAGVMGDTGDVDKITLDIPPMDNNIEITF